MGAALNTVPHGLHQRTSMKAASRRAVTSAQKPTLPTVTTTKGDIVSSNPTLNTGEANRTVAPRCTQLPLTFSPPFPKTGTPLTRINATLN
eukprot:5863240-Amphidinium_carterae.1